MMYNKNISDYKYFTTAERMNVRVNANMSAPTQRELLRLNQKRFKPDIFW